MDAFHAQKVEQGIQAGLQVEEGQFDDPDGQANQYGIVLGTFRYVTTGLEWSTPD